MRHPHRIIKLLAVAAAAIGMGSCRWHSGELVHGYIEGEYVYVGSPVAGRLQALAVSRGDQVKIGDELFSLENTPWRSERDEAASRLAQAKAQLEDLRSGLRPSEIESIQARLEQARASLTFDETEFRRMKDLHRTKAAPTNDLDKARSAFEQSQARVAELEAELQTASLGSRAGQVAAQESLVSALTAALAKADWQLEQTVGKSAVDAAVVDTLFRVGEWVNEGKPVVMLLPPGNIKARTFVPEALLSTIHIGDDVQVTFDGGDDPVHAKITFIAPNAEFTPPVIFSRESREKLVFLVELAFDPAQAAKLHPGQPIDIEFGG